MVFLILESRVQYSRHLFSSPLPPREKEKGVEKGATAKKPFDGIGSLIAG